MSNEERRVEIIETRNRHLESFADWMIRSGLSPLDYEFVEEKRSDGVLVWYFQKRVKNDAIEDSCAKEFIS